MRVDVHIHNHSGLEMDLLQAIHKLLKQMPTVKDFSDLRSEMNASHDNLSADITRLEGRSNPGGLTAEEAEAILSEYRELGARYKVLADRVADPENGTPV